jgi:hypothetical protein
MGGTHYFGYLLVALSGVLLAQHWRLWRDASLRPMPVADVEYVRRQLQRRSVASGLIGVVGAAMTLIDHVPRTPWSLTAYLCGLMLGGAVILAIALADMRAARRRRDAQHLDLVARELAKASQRPLCSPPLDGEGLGEG